MQQLTELRTLELHNNQFSGELPSWLAELPHLKALNVSNNSGLGGELPEALLALQAIGYFGTQIRLPLAESASGSGHATDLAYDCTAVSGLPISECKVLVRLYKQTDGPNWRDDTGWLATQTPCLWSGVVCSNGTVTGLLLDNNGLNGMLPIEIGAISK